MTENKEQIKRKRLFGLEASDYEHPLDRSALEKLESIPGIRAIVSQIWEKFLDRLYYFESTGSRIELNKENYPDLFNIYLEACSILDMKKTPPLYLENSPLINAFAHGVSRPYIGITYGAIERLETDELLFILAHELGHIKSEHVLYRDVAENFKAIIEIASQMSLGIAGLVGGGFQVALRYWWRMSEFTADRSGLLACQDSKTSIRTIIKMSGLPVHKIGVDAFEKSFLKQAHDFEEFDYGSLNKLIRFWSTADNTHPWSVLRASELLKWEGSEEYKSILKGEKIQPSRTISKDEKFCHECGSKLLPLDNFCGVCGAKITN